MYTNSQQWWKVEAAPKYRPHLPSFYVRASNKEEATELGNKIIEDNTEYYVEAVYEVDDNGILGNV